ncbi:EAL domain-containing protein [Pseudomonas cremoricolorata]|uniref:Diguanylate phosphodiesterase n=1 Tax=Pseudomonas cremoricolorata TaxID=157783 RepID=A0A089Y7J9_9PSED|nr:EAL domain-containing protein [Pseudomonas cremoricolorata]AIR87823.1 diguanylate phosphodiesterase [Pseudomonas cremoricolorata]
MTRSTEPQPAPRSVGCRRCADQAPLPFDFSMAFQPIVAPGRQQVFAYEALVRGTDGSSAYSVLSKVTEDNRYTFDQTCRIKAVELAAQLNLQGYLSINFLPNAVYQPAACIRATLDAAQRVGFPTSRIIFEVTENESLTDRTHLKNILIEYQRQGFKTAIDDFGAGYSGLGLLAEFQPDIIKLDMELIRGVDHDTARLAIVEGIVGICRKLGIRIIAEGVEQVAEYRALRALGIDLFQGYLFARPAYQALPEPQWPLD